MVFVLIFNLSVCFVELKTAYYLKILFNPLFSNLSPFSALSVSYELTPKRRKKKEEEAFATIILVCISRRSNF